jgi:hypothetical protein
MTSQIVTERRQCPRFPVRHIAHLLFIATVIDGKLPANYLPLTLMGRTLNISETGLMLKAEGARVNEEYLATSDYSLRIVVAIPSGPVEIYARPMHHERSEGGDYLIGARIERMSIEERLRLREYLSDCSAVI